MTGRIGNFGDFHEVSDTWSPIDDVVSKMNGPTSPAHRASLSSLMNMNSAWRSQSRTNPVQPLPFRFALQLRTPGIHPSSTTM